MLTEGLIRYTSFWAGKNGKALNNLSLNIKLKKVKTSTKFESNFLTKESGKNDWIDFGIIIWKNNEAEVNMFYELVEEGSNDFKKI